MYLSARVILVYTYIDIVLHSDVRCVCFAQYVHLDPLAVLQVVINKCRKCRNYYKKFLRRRDNKTIAGHFNINSLTADSRTETTEKKHNYSHTT